MEAALRMWTYLFRSLRLRCPRCGRGRIFRTFFKMFDHCVYCGLKYAREEGYFLGSIYFNYGLTAFVVTIGYPLLVFGFAFPSEIVFWLALGFCILFPIWFFRYARSLWIAFDQLFDPEELCNPQKRKQQIGTGTSDQEQR
jgi:uncharacterized protein (DUF983 family)